MKPLRHVRICCAWIAAIGLSMILPACAEQPRRVGEYAGMMKKAEGYTYVLGACTSRGFDTPPYIPGKIRFELEIYMREKGLLAPDSQPEKRLVANVESEVIYPLSVVQRSRVPSEAYQELRSTVTVTDAQTGDKIAEWVLRSWNGFGETSSDFTEKEHAKDIAGFLERIVR